MKSDATATWAPEDHVAIAAEGQTRSAVVALLVDAGACTASHIGAELGMSAAGVRRHLDALIAADHVEVSPRASRAGGRGRPAKLFQLTRAGRATLRHTYDELAGAAMHKLRDVGGESAVREFAAECIEAVVGPISAADDASQTVGTANRIAAALTDAGYSATTARVGSGVQICQHHCPVSGVAQEFPELCEAETALFSSLLGTHVQRLATIANGDYACTTHVPLPTTDLPTPHSPPTIDE